MGLYGPINEKPPTVGVEGLTGPGDWPYSRDAYRSLERITTGERGCQFSLTPRLGNSGRGNYAQNFLKPTPGRPACGCAAYRGEAQMAVKGMNLDQMLTAADGSVSHITARFWLGVIPFRNRADSPSVIGGRTW